MLTLVGVTDSESRTLVNMGTTPCWNCCVGLARFQLRSPSERRWYDRARFERVQPYDFGALALRLIISTDFLTSGWSTVKDPVGRGKINGLPPAFMMFIGVAELAGSAGLIFGVFARWAALGLMLIMAGAIQKKIFVWHTGFWGKDGYGWHYDLTLVTMNLMIALAGPGQLSLLP